MSRTVEVEAKSEPLVEEAAVLHPVWILDHATGQWVEKQLTDSQRATENIFDPEAAIDTDPLNLDPEWLFLPDGHGKKFEYQWVNADPKHHATARSYGYVPVDTKRVILRSIPALAVAGLGTVYQFKDVILFEMPRVLAEARRKATQKRDREEQAVTLYGMVNPPKGSPLRAVDNEGGVPSSYEQFVGGRVNPAQAAADSLLDAMERVADLTGRAR